MLDRSGFVSYLECLPLPVQGSNHGYPLVQLLLMFMRGVWCGIERYVYLDITRLDNNLQRLYGWERMPGHKAFERYFRNSTFQQIMLFSGVFTVGSSII